MFVARCKSPLSIQNLEPVLCLWEAGIGDHERAVLAERIDVLIGVEQVSASLSAT